MDNVPLGTSTGNIDWGSNDDTDFCEMLDEVESAGFTENQSMFFFFKKFI